MGWKEERGRLGAYKSRQVSDTDPRVIETKQNLRAEWLAEYIQQKVDEAPPLTQEQCDRIALALHGRPQAVAPGGDAA